MKNFWREIMQLFIGAFSTYNTIELVSFILGIIAVAMTIAFIFLSFKAETGKIFKLFSHLILPVIAITILFALMFMRLNVVSDVLAFVIGFGIAVACELIAFAVAYLVYKKKENSSL